MSRICIEMLYIKLQCCYTETCALNIHVYCEKWVLKSSSLLCMLVHLKGAARAAVAAHRRRRRWWGGARAKVGTLAAAALGRRPGVAAVGPPALAEPGVGGGARCLGGAPVACRRQPTCCRRLLILPLRTAG